MEETEFGRLSPYMVLIPPDETGDLPLDGYDPDYHCPKYRVITVAMQIAMIKEEKKADGSFLYDEPVLEPQKKAVDMIPTGDLIPPVGSWFDSEDDAKAFVTAVARSCDVSVNVVHMWWTGWSLYQFLNKASEFLYSRSRKKNEDEWRSLSLQERRDKLWRIVIKESPLARDFTPELASHVLLMLVCASRALNDDKKGLRGSNGMTSKLEKLQNWFEENDKSALDEFDALHPHHRDPNHPNHSVKPGDRRGKAKNTGEANNNSGKPKNMSKPKNRGKARHQCQGEQRRRKGRQLPPGLSARKPIQAQLDRYRAPPVRQARPQPPRHPHPNPIPHPRPERRTELSLRSRNDRRYHPY